MLPYRFSPILLETANKAEALCVHAFRNIDDVYQITSEKVLRAFISNRVSDAHLKGTTGYGYGDLGRDTLDQVFANVLDAEDALVRHTFVNGTHALSVGLFGLLRPGDTLLSVTGTPYDTLHEVIFGEKSGSLKEFGIKYEQVDLKPEGTVNLPLALQKVKNAKVAYIQRSRGYSLRPSLTISQMEEIITALKKENPDVIVMVDNCYGEFTEPKEPTAVGADLIAGSLIKNLGGGIAKTGGYLAGRKDLVELCSYRLTTPGTGKEVGCSLEQNRELYLGLFMAPQAVQSALKTSVFACAFFEVLGYETYPKYNEPRTDIIAALQLGGKEELIAFCQGIQAGSPVDSFAAPEPWDMPGYDSQVIMAAGAFTMGASIELSADAPLREPYTVFLQGGLTYPTGKLGVLTAAQHLLDKNLLRMDAERERYET